MNKALKLAVMALCLAPAAQAQEEADSLALSMQDEQAFTFTEAQLGGDEDVTQNITLISSNRNVYASQVNYRFSPARFKYRAMGTKYNEVFINGNPVNDAERGEFNFSFVGGLNNQTRSQESALPFEDNLFGMTGMAGGSNYNFRPSSFATGHRVSIAGGNRSYNTRAMYTYNSGMTEKGWAFTGSLTYRWGNGLGYIDGTFYNALSYFFGVEKMLSDHHSLSLVTWGNPTERGAQAASTDEMYWIANSNFYNPNWGYQDGKKRNSRIVKSFSPAALLTWDWVKDDNTKLVTSLLGKLSKYSSSRLNYNNSTNPAPDYYSLMPSYYYDVWAPYDEDSRTPIDFSNWSNAYNYLKASEQNRQINWDRLYWSNRMANAQGVDAMYYQQAYHDDQLSFSLSSTLQKQLRKNQTLVAGLNLQANKGMHYQTMEDLLGANQFRNINTYVVGTYAENSNEVQYDVNAPNRSIAVGDRFGYDYNIFVNKANAWATYAIDNNRSHFFVSARIGGTTMQREGKMRNGLFIDNSFGKGKTAKFLDGGAKAGVQHQLAPGHMVTAGVGYELKAPQARNAFAAPQMNNDFASSLKNEKVFSAEVSYQLQTSWMKANLNAYLSRLHDVSEYSMAYSDIKNSFSYISLTGISKEYIGAELGIDFKVTNSFNIKMLGTVSDAKYTNNARVLYLLSDGTPDADGRLYHRDWCMNKGMREGGTPLTAGSIDLSYHAGGWFIDLIGNYYDRIYLYYSPITRYYKDFPTLKDASNQPILDANGEPLHDISNVPAQAKGHGGFMLDASIGKSIYIRRGGQLSFNLMLTNILNNIKIVTGGMEQNRRDVDEQGETIRTYSFQDSPKKFYANGTNGMLMITYRF